MVRARLALLLAAGILTACGGARHRQRRRQRPGSPGT